MRRGIHIQNGVVTLNTPTEAMKVDTIYNRRTIVLLTLLLLLILVPHRTRAITEVRTESLTGYRIDYVNDEETIVINWDKGYATLIATNEDANTITEFYYDENFALITVDGCYGKQKIYSGGKLVKIVYLNYNNQPTKNSSGYAIVHRVVDENGYCIKETYHDETDNPIALSAGQYGMCRDGFDDQGRVLYYTYLGADGYPTQRTDGYSSAYRIYEDGKSVVSMYFDIDGNPAVLPLGQSGVREIRDYETGKHIGTTYLDASGNPIINKHGYTTVMYKYDKWNNLWCYLYYGIDGEPVALSRGQYGQVVAYERKERVRTYFIDKDGNELFTLDTYLGNSMGVCLIIAIGLTLMTCILPRRYCTILLCIYAIGIIYITLWVREIGVAQLNLELFWSYRSFFANKELRNQIIMNIALFIPLGALVHSTLLLPKKVLISLGISIGLSVAIELAQYVFNLGLCELDDIVSNSLGGGIGIAIVLLLQKCNLFLLQTKKPGQKSPDCQNSRKFENKK